MLRQFLVFAFLLPFFSCKNESLRLNVELKLVNLTHLNHLYEPVVIEGREMAIIHIYSEYPDYGWVDADDEGIACVDDAARAAVVYLRHFEIAGDSSSLNRARKLLDFCRYMQDADGQFYNFIFTDHSINREGKTSHKSFGWWAARGLWALGEGFRVFSEQHPSYAAILEKHIRKTFVHIDTLLAHYPKIEEMNGFKAPKWLLYNSAADATSELMLGLAAYAESSGDSKLKGYLKTFAKGLIEMQMGDEHTFPYGLFLSWNNVWHGWGNSQTQALAYVSKIIEDEDIQKAAMREASFFYPFWMNKEFPREFKFLHEDTIRIEKADKFSQIAYAVRPTVVGALRLFEITKEDRFAELAGELVTWFFGNNPAKVQMYDPKTGRCFDGILSETEINRNSGAESTIEALYSILEVEANSIAKSKLDQYLARP
ncbi:MAG: hypothetical protein ACE5IW_07780 [bacterium]